LVLHAIQRTSHSIWFYSKECMCITAYTFMFRQSLPVDQYTVYITGFVTMDLQYLVFASTKRSATRKQSYLHTLPWNLLSRNWTNRQIENGACFYGGLLLPREIFCLKGWNKLSFSMAICKEKYIFNLRTIFF